MVTAAIKYGTSKIAKGRLMREAKVFNRRPELAKRIYAQRLAREYLDEDTEMANAIMDGLYDLINANNPNELGSGSNLIHLYRRIKAFRISCWIGAWYIPFLWFMFMLSLTAMVGLGMDSLWLVSYVLPGQTVFLLGYLSAAFIGTLYMFAAALVYKIRFVDCFSGYKLVIFTACLAFYWIPPFAMFPWVWLWCASVALIQERNSEGAEALTW